MPATLSTRRHRFAPRPVVRITTAVVVLTIVVLGAQKAPSAATPQPTRSTPLSILPTNVGIGVGSTRSVTIDFAQPMDAASVTGGLLVYPENAVRPSWSTDARHLTLTAASRWQPDEQYLVLVPASARLVNGSVLGAPLRFAFTTQTAPRIIEFSVHRAGAREIREALTRTVTDGDAVPLADTATEASGRTQIGIQFSTQMNHADVERGFTISPHVGGDLSWDGSTLLFTPTVRLTPSARYAVTVVGAHDLQGNLLSGDVSFSFTIASRARIIRVAPRDGSQDFTGRQVQVWFSGSVDAAATGKAFALYDVSGKHRVSGSLKWAADGARLMFTSQKPLAAGHRFEVRIGTGSVDTDGNPLAETFGFSTRAAAAQRAAAPAPARPAYSVPAPSGSAQAYALALINASRKAYGFAPLRLDAALSAVASAHAWDQIRYGYFSHYSRDGSSFRDRLTAAGISFSHAGENQCEDYGSITHALSWCHSIMMAEPYPGVWNHIANILDPNFTRVGFGYGQGSDGKLVMTWDFAG